MAKTYCIMNVQKRHMADVRGLQDEANRTAERYRNNVDPARTSDNVYLVRSDDWQVSIKDVLERNGVEARSNSVVLLTSVYSASPEWFTENSGKTQMDYFRACLEFERRRGAVISAVIHMDEDTPHMQVATVPIVDVPTYTYKPVMELDADGNEVPAVYKSGKCKGQPKKRRAPVMDDQGNVVTHRGLNAAYVIGNKVKMSKTQTEFWECCGRPYGLDRGEIRVEDEDESRRRLTESEYKAERIVEDAKRKARKIGLEAAQSRSEAKKALRAAKDLLTALEGLQGDYKAILDGLPDERQRRERLEALSRKFGDLEGMDEIQPEGYSR